MRLTFRHVKLVHTAIFVVLSACALYVLYSGATARVTTWTWVAVAAIVGEGVALALSGGRCPLTRLAERLGATDGSVADLFLPEVVRRPDISNLRKRVPDRMRAPRGAAPRGVDSAAMPTLESAAPVLASLDIERSVQFYCARLRRRASERADRGQAVGSREFGILDPDGNLVTFAERRHG